MADNNPGGPIHLREDGSHSWPPARDTLAEHNAELDSQALLRVRSRIIDPVFRLQVRKLLEAADASDAGGSQG